MRGLGAVKTVKTVERLAISVALAALFGIFVLNAPTSADLVRAVPQSGAGGGGGSSLPVVDTTAVVKGSADPAKLLRLEIDNINPGTAVWTASVDHGVCPGAQATNCLVSAGDTVLTNAAGNYILRDGSNSSGLSLLSGAGATAAKSIQGGNASGTDIATGTFLISPGASTGTAASGNIGFKRVPTTQSSGEVNNSLVDAMIVVSKAKTLTDATATAILQVTDTSAPAARAGGQVFFTATVNSSSNSAAVTGSFYWAFVDETVGAGGETCTAALVGTNVNVATTDTFTCTVATTVASGVCNLQLNCDSSLNVASEVFYTAVSNSRNATITPQ